MCWRSNTAAFVCAAAVAVAFGVMVSAGGCSTGNQDLEGAAGLNSLGDDAAVQSGSDGGALSGDDAAGEPEEADDAGEPAAAADLASDATVSGFESTDLGITASGDVLDEPSGTGDLAAVAAAAGGALQSVSISSAAGYTSATAACAESPSGIVAWWPGDNYANDFWDGYGDDLEEDATFGAGYVGQAFDFDGAADFVEANETTSRDLDGFDELTIEAWVMPRRVDGLRTVVSKYDSRPGPGPSYILLVRDGGVLQLGVFEQAGSSFNPEIYANIKSDSTIVTEGVHTHVAGVWHGADQFDLYVNGSPVTGTVSVLGGRPPVMADTDIPVNVGRVQSISGSETRPAMHFDGLIDEPTVYDRALPAAEIAAIYEAGRIGKCKFQLDPAWPLCGRVTEDAEWLAANPDWLAEDGCPSSRLGAAYTDFPFSSTFGPRLKASDDDRYDYHRGIDLPTDVSVPVFAISGGKVLIAAMSHSAYPNGAPLVKIRHNRPGRSSCTDGGCYYSYYMHLASLEVSYGNYVSTGDLIGYTGTSASNYPHLHFEVRSAPTNDKYSAWSRDTVHPLRVLPYQDQGPEHLSVAIESGPGSQVDPTYTAVVTLPGPSGRADGVCSDVGAEPPCELDLARVIATLYRLEGEAATEIDQEAAQHVEPQNAIGGYHVNAPWFDMDWWNFQWSHKNTSSQSWTAFNDDSGSLSCPWYDQHATDTQSWPAAPYSPHYHLDRTDGDPYVGVFNGLSIDPDLDPDPAIAENFSKYSAEYQLRVTFGELTGLTQAQADACNPGPCLCAVIRAEDVNGSWSEVTDCP